MRLEVTIPATVGAPDDEDTLAIVNATIATKATAWTAPVHIGERDGQYVYATDAQPRSSVVTTANIAPTLLPPTVT